MRIIAFLCLAALIAGCHGKTFNVSDGQSRLVEAKHRAVLSVKRPVIGVEGQPVLDDRGRAVTSVAVCAEPSPDALQSTALALGGEASADKIGAILEASFVQSETQDYVGLRTQTIQLLRDAYFRLCEAFMNDGIDTIAYDVLQRRFQSQIVALLAVEQLTGAVVAGRRGPAGDPATHLAHIADALEESEQTLRDLERERDKAEEHLSTLKGKKVPDKDKKIHEAAVEATREAVTTLEGQIERRQQVIRLLKASYETAVLRMATHEVSESNEASKSVAGRSAVTGVAEAVRAITLNAINQDYESQVCFETLRYHNHLGQFRNNANNAFDSGGIPTKLKDPIFLHHCANLFATQADFRNARVSTAEAFADAVKTVTEKIGTGTLSAKDAVAYIDALAEVVPTEPGVAFLPRDPKGVTMQLPVDGELEIDGKFKATASTKGATVGSPGSGQ